MLSVVDLQTQFATRRGLVHAVNGVSFEIEQGELVSIVGETGSGKSATINSILGLIRPPGRVVSGEAWFKGQDLLSLPQREFRRLRGSKIGYVPQNPFGSLNPILRIERQFQNVIRAHIPASRREVRERAFEKLNAVGLAGPARVLDGYAHELSGGMAQKVVIALAMVLDPKLLVADEPTTGLDLTVQRQIMDLIEQLVQGADRSLLLVTHDLGIAAHYCNRVIVMYRGRIVEEGLVSNVFRHPRHPYTQTLLQSVPQRARD